MMTLRRGSLARRRRRPRTPTARLPSCPLLPFLLLRLLLRLRASRAPVPLLIALWTTLRLLRRHRAGNPSIPSNTPRISARRTSAPSRRASGSRPPIRTSSSFRCARCQCLICRVSFFGVVVGALCACGVSSDTISSHDKKRNYLECLEQYVQWLHEQIRLLGREPLPIERVEPQRDHRLSCRSIRVRLCDLIHLICRLFRGWGLIFIIRARRRSSSIWKMTTASSTRRWSRAREK